MSKKKKNKVEMVIDNVNIHELDHNQLLQFANSLNNNLVKERENRILLQVDRDQLNVFLSTTKENLTKLVFDVSNMHRKAEENARQISDLEKRLRQQRVQSINENNYNLDRMHLENEKFARSLAEEYRKQTNELFRLNSSLQEMARNKNIEHRNNIKDIQLKYIKLINEKADKLESHMVQVLGQTDEKRFEMFKEVEGMHYLEIQNHQSIYDKNVRLTIEKYTEEISNLKTYYNDRCEKALALVDHLKDKLQKVIEKNLHADKRMSDLRKENKKLKGIFQEREKRNQYLENKIKNFDSCLRASENTTKQLKKYKTLFQIKSCENEILENDNSEMKQAFKKYDDYFINVILDLQSRFTDVQFLTGELNLTLNINFSTNYVNFIFLNKILARQS